MMARKIWTVLSRESPDVICLSADCCEHLSHLITLQGLKAADCLLKRRQKPWKFFASLATCCNTVRDLSKQFFVTWSHLPTQYLNGEPVGYKVTYYPDGLESVINLVAVNLTNKTELTNLSAFTMYVINISAVSSGGVGPWNTIKARTDDAGTEETDRL